MDLNALLHEKNIDAKTVMVMRHRPEERELRKVLPWLAGERPEIFTAFQQNHSDKVQNALTKAKHLASFIAHGGGQALFVGLYSVKGWKQITKDQFWRIPENQTLKTFGAKGMVKREKSLWFTLELAPFYSEWKGKLIVNWPPPERAWWRWARRNVIPVAAILQDSALDSAMPPWEKIDLTWEELSILPTRWRAKLSEWRAIYYIFDTSDRRGYVGSAYGDTNLLGRWLNYGARGHGGNVLLRERDPKNFRFAILQRVSPDMEAADVIALEGTWKERLHTREPFGLNEN